MVRIESLKNSLLALILCVFPHDRKGFLTLQTLPVFVGSKLLFCLPGVALIPVENTIGESDDSVCRVTSFHPF